MSVEQHLRIFAAKQGLRGAALNEAVTGWISRSREPRPAPRTWTPAQWKSAADRRTLAAEATAAQSTTGDAFAAYPMDRWQHYNGRRARRCVAFNWPTKFFSAQRCAGRQRKTSPYCSRHRALDADLAAAELKAQLDLGKVDLQAVEDVLTWGEKLETTLQKPIVWRFVLDPGLLDNISCSLEGGGIAHEVLEQLPAHDGPLELAGHARPWEKGDGLGWAELDDAASMRAARRFAYATAGPQLGRWDHLRLRPGQEERVGPRRRRRPLEAEIVFELGHWRAP